MSGRTLRDICDDQRKEAERVKDSNPDLAAKLREWADYLENVISKGKDLLGLLLNHARQTTRRPPKSRPARSLS